MNRIFQLIIFLSIFTLLTLLLNSYTILRIASLFKFDNNPLLYSLIIILTVGFPLFTILEKQLPNIITRILYTLSALWFGILLFLFFSLVIYEIVNLIFKVNPMIAGITIVAIVLLLTTISIISSFFVVIKEVDIPIQGLKTDLDVVQLSDIHIGTIRNSAYLNKIIKKTNQLDPDIVAITGDLVDGSAPLHEDMFDPFSKLRGKIFFVSGNHEQYEGIDNVYRLFNKSTIKILDNKVDKFDGIQVIGVPFSEGRNYLGNELLKLDYDKDMPTILLYHPPAEMKEAKDAGIDLQLSGHTHAGQIFPFTIFTKMFFPKHHGLYDIDGMKLYVSPGTGTWGPYMRFGSLNEITLLHLKKA